MMDCLLLLLLKVIYIKNILIINFFYFNFVYIKSYKKIIIKILSFF